MSIHALTHVFRRSFGNPTRKLIMATLADFADEAGVSWPSIDTLANRAECSRRSVQDHLATLVAEGAIEIFTNAGQNGTNRYRIIFKKTTPSSPASKRGADSARGVQNGGADLHPGGVQNSGADLHPNRQEPSLIHQEGEGSPSLPAVSPIIENLHRAFPDAPRAIVGREHAEMTAQQPTLAEMTGEDWQALRAWQKAPLRVIERRTRWPRDRAEFLANAGNVLEIVRRWWKSGGRSWAARQGRARPKAATLPESPGETIEDPQEALRILRGS